MSLQCYTCVRALVCTYVIYLCWGLCSPSGVQHEETPPYCHSELPWQQVIWHRIWITWLKMNELPVWHAWCTILNVFVCVYIFISVCLSPLCFSAIQYVCLCICIICMTISACVCAFPEKSRGGEDLTLQGLVLTLSLSCSSDTSLKVLGKGVRWQHVYVYVCPFCVRVCVCNVDDGLGSWGVAGLQCCCQDKQLRLCLGQVFHSDSAHWN